MIFFYCSVSLADVTQELAYKVSQNGTEIGERKIQITYLPTSKRTPWGGKKIDFHTKLSLNIAGNPIHYEQRGAAQFSPDRASFVVSNQINQDLVELQGRRISSGTWIVHSIHNGVAKKVEFPGTEVKDISIEMFGMENWMEADPLHLLVIDSVDMYKVNGVWNEDKSIDYPVKHRDQAERSLSFYNDGVHINTVYNKDGILLYGNVQIQGVQLEVSLTTDIKELSFGDVLIPSGFEGINEKDL